MSDDVDVEEVVKRASVVAEGAVTKPGRSAGKAQGWQAAPSPLLPCMEATCDA